MDYFMEFINTMGFPIAISSFLLIRLDSKLEQLNKTLIQLLETVSKKNK
ncbi:YvrJ protein family protein [Filibacter tadaridae]|uniref:YvrJ protein family protein n=2 Tax=Filibacter tadaridae TaxID=2483811 RepID=A0A3P5W963_9BACL|nr:YvrJ protein family protein [Filibacter tadaridae]